MTPGNRGRSRRRCASPTAVPDERVRRHTGEALAGIDLLQLCFRLGRCGRGALRRLAGRGNGVRAVRARRPWTASTAWAASLKAFRTSTPTLNATSSHATPPRGSGPRALSIARKSGRMRATWTLGLVSARPSLSARRFSEAARASLCADHGVPQRAVRAAGTHPARPRRRRVFFCAGRLAEHCSFARPDTSSLILTSIFSL